MLPGTVPEMKLLERSTKRLCPAVTPARKSDGIAPAMSLFDKSREASSGWREKAGKSPFSLLSLRRSVFNLRSEVNSGTAPVRALFVAEKLWRLLNFSSSSIGIGPLN